MWPMADDAARKRIRKMMAAGLVNCFSCGGAC
jgi:hypothetical protein